jgi:hypothetical protein
MPLDQLNPVPVTVILPNYLVAGDDWLIPVLRGPYTDPIWTASMRLAAGASSIESVATTDPDNFNFSFASADTAKLPPNIYQYSISVSDGTSRQTLQMGGVPVLANPASETWVKTETFLRKALRECEQCILDLLNQRTSAVSFGGKQYYFWDVDKLWKLRNELLAKAIAEEQQLLGNARSRLIIPMFVNR